MFHRTRFILALGLFLGVLAPVGAPGLLFAGDPAGSGLDWIGEPVTPTSFDGDVRDLPIEPTWKPGDPIKEVPRRFFAPLKADPAPPWLAVAPDPLVALQAASEADAAQTGRAIGNPLLNFAGQGNTGVNPPDPVGDIGPTHYIQSINGSAGALFTIYDKAGTLVAGPTAMKNLGGSGACTSTLGDPIILYDRPADRWFLLEFSSSSGKSLCVHVSKGPNPVTDGWWNYTFTQATFPDYPHCGVWPDAYYCTANEGNPPVYAFDRTNMLTGGTARTQQTFRASSLSGYGFQALTGAHFMGANAVPGSTPYPILRHVDDEAHTGSPNTSNDFLDLFTLSLNWTTPASSSFTSTPTKITIAEFNSWLLDYSTFATVPQPGTTSRLDPIREVVLNRLNYRNFGTHESMVGTFATNIDPARSGSVVDSGVRWFELRRTPAGSGSWSLFQEGTFGNGGTNTQQLLGSIAQDGSGNLGLGYNVTQINSPAINPSLRYTGRLSSDPLGTMTQGEKDIILGGGTNTSGRWGDYAAIGVDPADDCTFWFTSQYQPSSAWATRIASFKFSECGCLVTPAAPTGIGASVPGSNTIRIDWNDAAAASITRYFVFRSTAAGGPYTQVATVNDSSPGSGGGAPYTWDDTTVSGGVRYHYVVQANDGLACTSANSAEVDAIATGICTLAPAFTGLSTVANPAGTTCTLNLSWSAGTSACGTSLTYSVYRGTSAAFVPDDATNRIASGLSGTTHSDSNGLVSGTTYYYVVRAIDSVSGTADGNTTRRSGVPTGALTPGTFTSGAESGHPAMTFSGNWATSTTYKRTGSNSWFSGYTAGDCGALTTPDIGLGSGSVISWYQIWSIESGWDGGRVEISTDGGTNWAALTPTPAYPSTITNAGNGCGWPTSTAVYSSNSSGYPNTWQAASVALAAAYDNKTIRVRWRFSTDGSVAGNLANPGWYIDDVQVTNALIPGSCTTGTGCSAPGAPTLTAATATCSGVSLSWTAGTGSTATYNVYRSDGACPGGAFAKIAGPLGTTSYVDATAAAGSTYSYQVRGACDAAGNTVSSPSNCLGATATTAPAAPAAPNLTPGCTTVGVSWGAVTGALDYEVWRAGGAGCAGATQVAGSTSGASSFNDTAVSAGSTYSYFVKAKNLCGTSANGACATATTSTSLGAPTGVSATGSCSGVSVSWTAVAGAASYTVHRGLSCGAADASFPGAVSPFADTSGTVGVNFSYWVVATNACGNGPASACATAARSDCAPSCTVLGPVTDFEATGTSDFTDVTCDSANWWGANAGTGEGSTQSWRGRSGNNVTNASSVTVSRVYSLNTVPASGLLLRFWSATSGLGSDDVGVVEVWTSDNPAWRYVSTVNYPAASATLPGTITACGGNLVAGQSVAAFQGTVPGASYTALLDPYLTASTTQVQVRFKLVAGATGSATRLVWYVDNVGLYEGAPRSVPRWEDSNGNAALGVIRSGAAEARFAWGDTENEAYRIYRSTNPASIRGDASSTIIRTETDTNAATYLWTTSGEGAPAGGIYFYKIYGYRSPCGESDAGDN